MSRIPHSSAHSQIRSTTYICNSGQSILSLTIYIAGLMAKAWEPSTPEAVDGRWLWRSPPRALVDVSHDNDEANSVPPSRSGSCRLPSSTSSSHFWRVLLHSTIPHYLRVLEDIKIPWELPPFSHLLENAKEAVATVPACALIFVRQAIWLCHSCILDDRTRGELLLVWTRMRRNQITVRDTTTRPMDLVHRYFLRHLYQ